MISLISSIQEGKASIDITGTFYNPFMKLSRDISVEVIKRIDDNLRVLDAFSASGIRGIRYKLESSNVEHVDFLDADLRVENTLKHNLSSNGVDGNIFITRFEDFNRFNDYNFIEIDPFGSPSKYIPALLSRIRRDRFYISVTATDTAVLCGRHGDACRRNYIAIPMRGRTCHETGLRILLGYIARIAFIYDYNIIPLIGFYYRHQMKLILRLDRDIRAIYNTMDRLGYLHRDRELRWGIGIRENVDLVGPLWIGNYYSREMIQDISIPLVQQILQELDVPYHYDIDELAERYRLSRIPKMSEIQRRLKSSRTHFNPKGIKIGGDLKELLDIMKS